MGQTRLYGKFSDGSICEGGGQPKCKTFGHPGLPLCHSVAADATSLCLLTTTTTASLPGFEKWKGLTTTLPWWKKWNATSSITTTTTTTAPSLASVSINIVLTIKNLPFSKLLANNVATPVLLAIKEAIAVEAGDQISAEMVSATLAANPASATATSVSAKVITPTGIPGDLVQQKLASNTGLGKSIASWVSWADGVATVQAGPIKVSNLVVASAAESVTTPGPTNVLAQFGEHRIVLSTLNHPSLLSLLMIAIGMCACCACALSSFVRLRQRKQHRSAAGGWQLVDVQEEVASERFQLGHQPSLLTRYMSSSSSPHQSGYAAENYAAYDALE